jgi:hypothetical protein
MEDRESPRARILDDDKEFLAGAKTMTFVLKPIAWRRLAGLVEAKRARKNEATGQ